MKVSQLPQTVRNAAGVETHTYEEIVAHIACKYPLVEYNGREVYLFGQEREFSDHRYIDAFHEACLLLRRRWASPTLRASTSASASTRA